jgi:uncharacterized protein (DUF488 family)
MRNAGGEMGDGSLLSVLTIGHSSHSYDRFLALLRRAEVTAVADVRAAPFSRRFPHFNIKELRQKLQLSNIAYVFLGKELGGRPRDRMLYCDNVADYEKMAATEQFREGLERVIEGVKKYRIALMCSEQDPLDCHRCLLVARALSERGEHVEHILANGSIFTQTQAEEKLLALSGRGADDLLMSWEERLAAAYRDRTRKVAFSGPPSDSWEQNRSGVAS